MHPPPFFRLAAAVFALAAQATAEIQHVIAISVDGLRGDFLQGFVDAAPAEFPNFVRLRNGSAFTYNARCDFDYSETVPNHLVMITGRPALLPSEHPATAFTGFTTNFPLTADTVHVYDSTAGTNSGPYKASIFDVAHDRGLSTALYLGKTRLAIVERSYDATNGALDVVGTDEGRDKIDFSQVQNGGTGSLISTLVGRIGGTLERFNLIHITDPDTAGHGSGWTTTVGGDYRNSIKTLDGYLGSILNAIDTNSVLTGKVAILLTGDHGGGGSTPANTHTDATRQGNYTIPFFLSAPGVARGSDLHALLENRFNPGTARPTYTTAAQPVRNGDIANLSTALLGLPSIPGAFLLPEFVKPLSVTRDAETLSVSWPIYLTGWTLEFTDALPDDAWQTVTSGIVKSGGQNVHTTSPPLPENRFFRLRRPTAF